MMERKAIINIEILEDADDLVYTTEYHGMTYLLMEGLTNAIKELEAEVPEKSRATFRSFTLKMLNRRD